MANAHQLAESTIQEVLTRADLEGLDHHSIYSALIWHLLSSMHRSGKTAADIASEVQFTLDNLGDDGDFHVVRN